MKGEPHVSQRIPPSVFRAADKRQREAEGQVKEQSTGKKEEGEEVSYNPYTANRRKYGNKKITVDGRTFDSKKEAHRYLELKTLEKAGHIYGLDCQKRFELIPKQIDANGETVRNCSYIADFVYHTKDGEMVVEDVKGVRTPEYIIKRKLMLYKYGITVREI